MQNINQRRQLASITKLHPASRAPNSAPRSHQFLAGQSPDLVSDDSDVRIAFDGKESRRLLLIVMGLMVAWGFGAILLLTMWPGP